jgi:hypothetical protein
MGRDDHLVGAEVSERIARGRNGILIADDPGRVDALPPQSDERPLEPLSRLAARLVDIGGEMLEPGSRQGRADQQDLGVRVALATGRDLGEKLPPLDRLVGDDEDPVGMSVGRGDLDVLGQGALRPTDEQQHAHRGEDRRDEEPGEDAGERSDDDRQQDPESDDHGAAEDIPFRAHWAVHRPSSHYLVTSVT